MPRRLYQFVNAFSLRHGLSVAVEVAYPDLSPLQTERLREFTNGLPAELGKFSVVLAEETQQDYITCLRHFKASDTWRWLRHDFKQALIDLEKSLAQR